MAIIVESGTRLVVQGATGEKRQRRLKTKNPRASTSDQRPSLVVGRR